MSSNKLLALLSKLAGLGGAVYGAQLHSLSTMTVGAAFAAVVHFIDSVWNTPKGSS